MLKSHTFTPTTLLLRRIPASLAVAFLLRLVFHTTGSIAGQTEIHWGEYQEGIRLGISFYDARLPNNGWIRIYAAPATNYAKNLFSPEPYQRFAFVLKDGEKEVPLKGNGTSYGAKVQTRLSRSDKIRQQLLFYNHQTSELGFLEIDKLFTLTEPKEYELVLQVRLLKEKDGKLERINFAPLTIKMRLHLNST